MLIHLAIAQEMLKQIRKYTARTIFPLVLQEVCYYTRNSQSWTSFIHECGIGLIYECLRNEESTNRFKQFHQLAITIMIILEPQQSRLLGFFKKIW